MEELLVTEQSPDPAQPAESTLALSFLREDIQDLRQDVRQIHERIDQTNGRIDDLRTEISGRIDQTNGRIDDLRTEISGHIGQTNGRIDDLAKQLDSRYARLMAMLIACTSILVTTMGAAVAVLK